MLFCRKKVHAANYFASSLIVSLFAASIAFSEEVTLVGKTGGITITGDLIEIAEGNYVLMTRFGLTRVRAELVDCEGPGCDGNGQAETVVAVSEPAPEPVVAAPAPPPLELPEAAITIAGNSTIAEDIMPLLIEGYAATLGVKVQTQEFEGDQGTPSGENELYAQFLGPDGAILTDQTFRVVMAGSGDAFEGLLSKEAQIGVATRRIDEEEATALSADGAGIMTEAGQERVIAVDTVTIIVNQANPVTQISLDQLAGIYSGQITNWSELGGLDAPIKAYTRQEGSGTARTIYQAIFPGKGDSADELEPLIAPTVARMGGTSEMTEAIATDPNGIGIAGFVRIRDAKPLDIVTRCGIVANADAFAAKAEEYAFQRRFYVYNRGDGMPDNVRAFLDYMTSEAADEPIAKTGVINLAIEQQDQATKSGAMQALTESATSDFERNITFDLALSYSEYDRLSVTFRFESGSSRLDTRAVRDLDRLVRFISALPSPPEFAIVGFTDADGSFEANLALSEARAEQVVQALRQVAGDRLGEVGIIAARGYGELSPTACNDDSAGKAINRRVEVWIRG
jgi:phosphate transport system substrate-binding protein